MPSKLCILACHNFHQELQASIATEGWEDVVAVSFPARCGRPSMSWEELRARVPEDCKDILVLGSACIKNLGEPPTGFPSTRVIPATQCFHLLAGEHLVNESMMSGAYLMTPAWLRDWRGHLRSMGFAPEQAGQFFRDSAKELVLLDSGLDPQAEAHLREFQETVNLPARRVNVGLDYARLLLVRWVMEWRLKLERQLSREHARSHAGEVADHVAAMDVLARLARTQHETEVIAGIEELFRMLFAPAALHYLKVENGIEIPADLVPVAMRQAMGNLQDDYAWTPDGEGFILRIRRGDDLQGLVAVDRLAYPAYRERYVNLALAITGVCGLAIENSRNRRRLLDAERMASLAILVAGVAHEINTPLGVSMAAATSLQEQARRLGESFAGRSMTQADLERYLQCAGTSTDLICRNMDRIGHLIDAFRQVAVEDKAVESHPLRLRECLDDVIRSLGNRIAPDQVTVNIHCEPDLQVESVAGDWASIFVNLISNSLKHGFRGRERGHIDIQVTSDGGHLRVDYRDDGVGLTPDTQARIFDPFFTTDMQNGTGLGMHLVYNLVTHRFRGSIQCQSAPGQGVRFQIDVPLPTPGTTS
jgi:signal transduction histidine kinase